jgi:hypothetical protein
LSRVQRGIPPRKRLQKLPIVALTSRQLSPFDYREGLHEAGLEEDALHFQQARMQGGAVTAELTGSRCTKALGFAQVSENLHIIATRKIVR